MDLPWQAREKFDTWRRLGLSESAAFEVLIRDGVIPRPVEREPTEADALAAEARAFGRPILAAVPHALSLDEAVDVLQGVAFGRVSDPVLIGEARRVAASSAAQLRERGDLTPRRRQTPGVSIRAIGDVVNGVVERLTS